MKNNFLGFVVLSGSILFTSTTFGQKATETSAAVEYKKFNEFFYKGDLESAKKSLVKAKENIDLAAAHDETKDSPKTQYYKGQIYSKFITVGMMSQDSNFVKMIGENGIDEAIAAYKKGYSSSDKFDGEIKDAIFGQKMEYEKFSSALYQKGDYANALEVYDLQVKLSDAINLTDTLSLYNAGICAQSAKNMSVAAQRFKKCAELNYRAPEIYSMASYALRQDKKTDEAKSILMLGRKKYPSDKGLLLEMVNTSLDEGNNAEAEKNLQDAIAADPNNKQLYYTIGTIYIDLKQNDKAEAALQKAIELDPNYADAQYQLGAHLLGVAGTLKEEASRLKFGDANYDKLMKQSDEYYKKALVPLEAYVTKSPNDKDVLTILFQIHKNLKNTEKALEYKKRADAVK